MKGPLASPDFRLLLGAQTVDTAGNAFLKATLAFAVLDIGGSTLDVGLVVGAEATGVVLFLLLGGVVGDRWPRGAVLVASNLVACFLQGVFAWSIFAGWAGVPTMVVLAFLTGASAALSVPAGGALLPWTVEAPLLQPANAIASSARSTIRILALVSGGAAAATIGPGWGLAINAVSYLLAAVLYALIRVRPSGRVDESSMLSDFRRGWSTFTARRWTPMVVVAFTIMNAAFAAGVVVLGPVIADRTIGRANWGLVLASESVGLLAASLWLTRSRHRARLATGMLGAVLTAPWMLTLAFRPTVGLLVVTGVVSGLGIGYFDVAWHVSLYQHIPADMLSRVMSIDAFGSLIAAPIGQISAGPLAAAFGAGPAIAGLAAVVAVAAGVTLLDPSVRRLEPGPGHPG